MPQAGTATGPGPIIDHKQGGLTELPCLIMLD